MKLILPVFLILISGALFFMYIDPTYDQVKVLRAEDAQYNAALERSQELIAVRDSLLTKYNSFSMDEIERLERLLPDNIDNVRLILDLDGIARTHGIALQDVTVSQPDRAGEDGGDQEIGSVELQFSVTAPYEVFLSFLRDIERSLRITDVAAINFTGVDAPGTQTTYDITMKTYWLR